MAAGLSGALEQACAAVGEVGLVAPPGQLDGHPLRWSSGPVPLGSDPPTWG